MKNIQNIFIFIALFLSFFFFISLVLCPLSFSFFSLLLYLKCLINNINIKEPEFGFAELFYSKLSIQKKQDGSPLFAFWDKKCLNFGQDFQEEFTNALVLSRAVILLISNSVCII